MPVPGASISKKLPGQWMKRNLYLHCLLFDHYYIYSYTLNLVGYAVCVGIFFALVVVDTPG